MTIFFNHVAALLFEVFAAYYYEKLYEKSYIHALLLRKLWKRGFQIKSLLSAMAQFHNAPCLS